MGESAIVIDEGGLGEWGGPHLSNKAGRGEGWGGLLARVTSCQPAQSPERK